MAPREPKHLPAPCLSTTEPWLPASHRAPGSREPQTMAPREPLRTWLSASHQHPAPLSLAPPGSMEPPLRETPLSLYYNIYLYLWGSFSLEPTGLCYFPSTPADSMDLKKWLLQGTATPRDQGPGIWDLVRGEFQYWRHMGSAGVAVQHPNCHICIFIS
jgi:hypothetical protein